ncbi:MAG: hypothetical protein P8J33_04745 [Pirellulaceae bacterium]|nr:hypothetical protein [Pirellulaceae bacterium]
MPALHATLRQLQLLQAASLPRPSLIIRCLAKLLTITFVAWVCEYAQAQVYRQVDPPAPILSLPPAGVNQTTFDPFQVPASKPGRLKPIETLGIPLGSWGDPSMWPPQELNSTTIKRFRQSFVQQAEFATTFIARNEENGIGLISATTNVMLTAPLGSTDSVLAVTPRYAADWLNGPAFIDVPSFLQGASVDIGWRRIFNQKWTFLAGIQPGYYNDRFSNAESFRMGALARLTYQITPEKLSVTLGIADLDQADYGIIPDVGLTWIPNPNTRFDLIFPEPKISRRVGHLPYLLEDWVYTAISFGGGTWAVQRASGLDDVLNLRDFRLTVGFERLLNGGSGFNIEAGYVFTRYMEYQSSKIRYDLPESFMFAAGLRF